MAMPRQGRLQKYAKKFAILVALCLTLTPSEIRAEPSIFDDDYKPPKPAVEKPPPPDPTEPPAPPPVRLKPTKPAPPKPVSPTPSTPTVRAPLARIPVPAAEAIATADRIIKDVYKAVYAK
jgi:hypothetical protein